jgi:hypothetical protein
MREKIAFQALFIILVLVINTYSEPIDLKTLASNLQGLSNVSQIENYLKEDPRNAYLLFLINEATNVRHEELYNMPEKLRKRVRIVSILPREFMSKKICRSLDFYMSKKDAMRLINTTKLNALQNNPPPKAGLSLVIPLLDPVLTDPQYLRAIATHIFQDNIEMDHL